MKNTADLETYPYGKQLIDEDDIQAVVEVLRSPLITQGPKALEFEKELALYCKAKYAVAVCNGTAALHLACLAAGLKPGQELITSPISFAASSNCGLYCGSNIQFVDIDPDTANLNPELLEKKITEKTRVVIPVHFAGQSCDMEQIQKIVQKKEKLFGTKIAIIEDAAHGLGGSYKNLPIGSCQYSDMAILSFHPVKSITTGEGGAILTNSKATYELLLKLRTHGITKDPKEMSQYPGPWYMEQQHLGYNFRITDIQCALGLSQLKKLDSFIQKRSELAKRYEQAFQGYDFIKCLTQHSYQKSAHHLFVLKLDFKKKKLDRGDFIRNLIEKRIGTQVHYIPIYKHPYYRENFKFSEKDFPESEKFYETCLSLPLYPALSFEAQDYIIKTIKQTIG